MRAVRLLFQLDLLFWGRVGSHLVNIVLEEVLIVSLVRCMELLVLLIALSGGWLEHMVAQLLLDYCGRCAPFGVDN